MISIEFLIKHLVYNQFYLNTYSISTQFQIKNTNNLIMSDYSEEVKQGTTDIFTANDPENGDSVPPAEIFEKAKIVSTDNSVAAPT